MATVFYFLPKNAELTPDRQLDELDYLIRKYNTRRVTKELWLKEFPERFSKRKEAS